MLLSNRGDSWRRPSERQDGSGRSDQDEARNRTAGAKEAPGEGAEASAAAAPAEDEEDLANFVCELPATD